MRDRAGALIVSLGLLAPICALAGNLVTGCVFDAASNCVENLGYGGACSASSDRGGATGHGGASSSSSGDTGATGGTGGHGGAGGGCALDTDCPMPAPGPCDPKPSCENHVCGVKFAVGPLAIQRKGDCKQRVCDATGHVVIEYDDADTYDDGNDCTTDICLNNKPVSNGTLGVACNQNGGTFCVLGDPDVYCAECNPSVPGSCLGGKTCDNTGHCAPSSCFDGMKNGTETATDCGGAACKKCTDGFTCVAGSDCYSGVCMGAPKVCVTATCSDGVTNPPESGTDCGGSVACSKCPDDDGCRRDADCMSHVCDNHKCIAPSCMDGVMNGTETDVDCGGTCPACL